jgi:hypothetical protein
MSLKRDELTNPNGCLNKAADDEPIFVLRANDVIAANIVRRWADGYLIEKREHSADGCLTKAQLEKAKEARGLANQMDAWRDFHDLGSVSGYRPRTIIETFEARVRFWKFVALIPLALAVGVLLGHLISWVRS